MSLTSYRTAPPRKNKTLSLRQREWSEWRDSNPRHAAWQAAALPTVLHSQKVARHGFEPWLLDLQSRVLPLHHPAKLVRLREAMISVSSTEVAVSCVHSVERSRGYYLQSTTPRRVYTVRTMEWWVRRELNSRCLLRGPDLQSGAT